MRTPVEVQAAIENLHGYNVSDPHPYLDRGVRLARIARAASDAGMHIDDLKTAVRAWMDTRTNQHGEHAPFPESRREELFIRVEAMMDLIMIEERRPA